MFVKASSIDALFSTNGVTSGGVTLSIPGSLVLVEIRALILSMSFHYPHLDPPVRCLALCSYSAQFAFPSPFIGVCAILLS